MYSESISEGDRKRKVRYGREKFEENQVDDGKETLKTVLDREAAIVTDQSYGKLPQINGGLTESISRGNIDYDLMKQRKNYRSDVHIRNNYERRNYDHRNYERRSYDHRNYERRNVNEVSKSYAYELDGMRSQSMRSGNKRFYESDRSDYPFQRARVNQACEKGLNEVKNETIAARSYYRKEAGHLSKGFDQFPRRIADSPRSGRKLLVLDVNGLLAHIIMPRPMDCKEDTNILGRSIFKRPYCDDFLKFCFQNFDVGIWSSRAKKIIDRVAEYLLADLMDRLLFCWDISQSTQTGFQTLENVHKPLVFKELRNIWEHNDPSSRWKKGDYNESNTLLLDDSPYKGLVNPLHTAIFPWPFNYKDKDDNSLGPGGDLRVYLESLLTSRDVRDYVEHHPFGQRAINETNTSWNFYSDVLRTMSSRAPVHNFI